MQMPGFNAVIRKFFFARAWIFLLLPVAICTHPTLMYGQAASSLLQAKKLYVEPFGAGNQADQLRQSLIKRLQKSGSYQVVDSANDADAIVKGDGQVWIKGHFTTNSRAPSTNRQAVYGGFLSAEIVSKSGEPLWSYLVTPSKFAWTSIADDLAGNLVKELLRARQENTTSGTAPGNNSNLTRTDLAGAGATFPAPLYHKWFQSFQQLHPEVHISYEAVGSEAGPRKLAGNAVDFAASDVASLGDGLRYMHIASVLGGVVPIYNLEDINHDLKFTPETLADIYLGKVKKWNDPEIRNSNRGVNLPDRDIVVLHRSDGSGTTYVWSDFLSQISSAWKSAVGTGSLLKWPTGTGVEGNEGVASAVQATPNSIGYVELVYAIQHQLSFGAVRNSSGEYIRASLNSLAEAAKSATMTTNTASPASIINPPGKDAYPIASFTWLLFPEKITDPAKKAALFELVQWILTTGQKECSALGYAPLPREVAAQQLNLLNASH